VKAKLDGVHYAGSLVKYGNPLHMLGVLKSIRERIGKSPGETIEVNFGRVICCERSRRLFSFGKLSKRRG
jgi:hypothetical protein